MKYYSILLQIELIIPCIIVFMSFLICLVSLLKVKTEFKKEETAKFRKVSVTITIFAGIFLACNIPAFLLQVNYLSLYLEGLTKTNRGLFMKWYGHLLSHFFLTFFNAAINPCLYLLRMPYFRQWMVLITKDPGMLFMKARALERARTSSSYVTGSRYNSSFKTSLVQSIRVGPTTRVSSSSVRIQRKSVETQRGRILATKSLSNGNVISFKEGKET